MTSEALVFEAMGLKRHHLRLHQKSLVLRPKGKDMRQRGGTGGGSGKINVTACFRGHVVLKEDKIEPVYDFERQVKLPLCLIVRYL